MKIFLDTADISVIRELAGTGMVDGITTNPSLVRKSGRAFGDVLREICSAVPGPISAEVVATEADAMVAEGERLAAIAPNIVVKVPLTWDGLRACRTLAANGRQVNVTLCFSTAQAFLAAKANATYISPFIGRLDDVGIDGLSLIADIREVYDAGGFTTKILAASVRSPRHVTESARLGADAATLPPEILRKLAQHPLTDRGLSAFLADWAKTGQSI